MQYNCHLENNTYSFYSNLQFYLNAQLLSVSQWWSQYFMLQYFLFCFFHVRCGAHMSSTILSAHQTYTVHTAIRHGNIISQNFTCVAQQLECQPCNPKVDGSSQSANVRSSQDPNRWAKGIAVVSL